MTYDVRLRIGIGDLICSKSLLLSYQGHVNIRLGYQYLGYRGKGYKIFLDDFVTRVFHEEKFSIVEDGECPPRGWGSLYNEGMRPSSLCLKKELCAGVPLKDQYLCIHTKVREGIALSTVSPYLPEIIDAISSISNKYSLVILGERNIESNPEYTAMNQDHIFTWYSSLQLLKGALDLTVPGLGVPCMKHFMQDCLYMSGAVCNISMGIGGNMLISNAVGKALHLTNSDPVVAKGMFGDRYSSAPNPRAFAQMIRLL